MVARLTVVVSQSSSGDSSSANLEESLVAELMMTEGLDATMIGPIESVDLDGTDALCLQSFNHSFAIISWLDQTNLDEQWKRLGLEGQVCSLGESNQASQDPQRKIYHLQLTGATESSEVLRQLRELLDSRRTPTVSIGLAPLPSPAGKATVPEPKVPASSTDAPQDAPAEAVKNSAMKPEMPKLAEDRTKPAQSEDEAEQEYAHLDRLIDDFDSLDL